MVFLHDYVRRFIAFSTEWAKDRVGNCQDPNSSTSSATPLAVIPTTALYLFVWSQNDAVLRPPSLR